MRPLLAQTAMELRLTARRGENLLVTLVLPLAVLVFVASTNLFPSAAGRPVDFLLPGVLALAIMSTGMVSLGIATAYERHYGVLKRLGGTPLTRPQLVGAKVLSVLAVEVVQAALLVAVAVLGFGWRPAGGLGAACLLALLGTAAFAGLGLLMAGSLRAEATLGVANGLYLVLLLIGGIFLPLDHLPGAVAALSPFLPATALAESLRAAFAGAAPAPLSLIVLAAWAVGAIVLAALTFRWE